LKSAEVTHSLLSLETLNYLRSPVSEQPKNPQLSIVYSESHLFLFNILDLPNLNPEVLDLKLS